MRIGVDIDLTVIQSDEAWWQWLKSVCLKDYSEASLAELKEKAGKGLDYNLANYFPEPLNPKLDGLDFWRGDSIYDTMKPVQGAIEKLTELSRDYEIVFITAIKGDHHKSKYNLIERLCDFPFSFIATKEKWLVNVDVMIDDRSKILNSFSGKVKKIMYNTPYTQDDPIKSDITVCNTWMDIAYVVGTLD